MRYYLAGPMTGIPQFNFPAFDKAAEDLRARGCEVLSPAEIDHPETRKVALASPDGEMDGGSVNGETIGDFMGRDIKIVLDDVDAVVVLPGWHESKGARLETFAARTFGKPVLSYPDLDRLAEWELALAHSPGRVLAEETVLEEAQRLIYGDRQASYGHPLDDFARTGRMWGAILGIPNVAAEQVGLCMAALKISRECNGHKRDNLTDGAGYFGTVAMVHDERERRERVLRDQYAWDDHDFSKWRADAADE